MNEQPVISVNAETGETKQTSLVVPKDFNWDLLEVADSGPSIAPTYLEFNTPGTKIRGVYIGSSVIEKKQENGTIKAVPVVVLLTKNGAVMNGGTSLYSNITKFCKNGDIIEIEFTGLKKMVLGNMKVYEIRPLKFPNNV